MREQRHQLVIHRADGAQGAAADRGRRQRLGHDSVARPLSHPAVGDELTVRGIEPRLRVRRRLGEPPQQWPGQIRLQRRVLRTLLADGALAERSGIDARLLPQRLHLGLEQAVLVLVQIKQRRHQQRQGRAR